MNREIFSLITYNIIKSYRDKYIQKPVSPEWKEDIIQDPDLVSDIIISAITSDNPCMISRFGNNELDTTLNYKTGHPLSFLRTIYPFWVGENTKRRMLTNAGFFPNDNNSLSQFADLVVGIVKEIDILGTWIGTENQLLINNDCKKVKLEYLEPFWSKTPWTKYLKGKKILVVHPFAKSIISQYQRRELLFNNTETLPEFGSLEIIKSVQSIGGVSNGFDSWFDAFHYMENQIDKTDYEIALIGCGAYGMPLAAHCKQMGKKAIHLGGATQLLFGIRGARWEIEKETYKQFMNEHWVRPLDSERPPEADAVENACYW